MAKTTITKILFRRGSDYDRKPTILDEGEPGWVTDTCRLYVGDGRTEGAFPVLNIRTPENAPLHAYNNELKYEPIGDITGTSQPPTQEVLALNHEGLSANLTRDWMDDRYVLKDPCLTNSLTNPADPVACDPNNDKLPTQVMQANLVTEGDVIIHGQANMTTGVAVSGGIQVQNGGVHVVGDSTFEENLQVKKDLQITGTTTGTTAVFEQLSLTTPLAIEDGGTGDDTGTKVANWDTAFGWGDHSQNGYLKSVDLGPGLVRDPATGQINLDFSPTAGLTVGSDGKITKGIERRAADTSQPGANDNSQFPGTEIEYMFIISGSHGTDTVSSSGVDIDQHYMTQEYNSGSALRGVLVSPDGPGSMWESICGAYRWALINAPAKANINFMIRHSCHMNHPEDDLQLTGTMNDPRPKGDINWERFNTISFHGYTNGGSAFTNSLGETKPYTSLEAVQMRARIQLNCGVGGLCLWFRGGVVHSNFVRFALNYDCANNVTKNGVVTTQQNGNGVLIRKSYYYWQWQFCSFTVHPPVNGTYATNDHPIQSQDGASIYINGNTLIDFAGMNSVNGAGHQQIFGSSGSSIIAIGAPTSATVMVNPPANSGYSSYGLAGVWFRINDLGSTGYSTVGSETYTAPSASSGTVTAETFNAGI